MSSSVSPGEVKLCELANVLPHSFWPRAKQATDIHDITYFLLISEGTTGNPIPAITNHTLYTLKTIIVGP